MNDGGEFASLPELVLQEMQNIISQQKTSEQPKHQPVSVGVFCVINFMLRFFPCQSKQRRRATCSLRSLRPSVEISQPHVHRVEGPASDGVLFYAYLTQ